MPSGSSDDNCPGGYWPPFSGARKGGEAGRVRCLGEAAITTVIPLASQWSSNTQSEARPEPVWPTVSSNRVGASFIGKRTGRQSMKDPDPEAPLLGRCEQPCGMNLTHNA